jgi:hypothetical protein
MNPSSTHNRNASNIPKDLNELLREFKRKKTNNNINISNLPNSKPKKSIENFENNTQEIINKNTFVKKYNNIMSEISTDYIVVQPKSNEIVDNRKHLKNLSLNNFIKSQMDKESPMKNIKKGILNTKIEDVNFDHFYMDSRNLNNIAKLSDSNKLVKDLKKNELLSNLQISLNGNNNDSLRNSLLKNNGHLGNHTRSYSVNNQISLKIKKEGKLIDDETENFNNINLFNSTSIKNDLSKITNILNFSNFNKSLNKKNSMNSKEEFSESIRKNNNSLKNSSGKTFYSTLSKTPNSKIKGNNNNECVISNYSHESISPERRNLSKDNLNKIGNYKTIANFFSFKNLLKRADSSDYNSNINDNNAIYNAYNINKKDSKSHLVMDKVQSLDLNCIEKLSDKIKFDDNFQSPVKKRDNYSMDISSNNISNFNSSRNLNFAKGEINYNDLAQNPETTYHNKYKNYNKINSLDLLSLENPTFDLPGNENKKEKSKNPFFAKINSLYPSKNSLFKSKDIKENNLFAEKYINFAKEKANFDINNNNSSKFNLSTFSTIRNELENASLIGNKNNYSKRIIWESNFDLVNNKESSKKTLTFELIKNDPCKYNKFNNFKHLREEVNKSQYSFNRNKNNLFNKSSSNFNRESTGYNNDVELTFSKNTNTFINKTTIVNKIEATKRLKLNK